MVNRIAIILAALSLLQGCGVSDPDRQPVNKARFSFVCEYRNFNFEDTTAICHADGAGIEIECPMMSYEERGVYSLYHYYKGSEADKRAFYALCEKNNDTRYDGIVAIGSYWWEVVSPTDWSVRAIKNDIVGVEITSDAAWGESYPAGASLNDLFDITYYSFAPYISSGYDDDIFKLTYGYTMPLSDITTLSALDANQPIKFFAPYPVSDDAGTLTVTVTLDSGEAITFTASPAK